eukprot:CAMPEP_0172202280 /NCGR_PEP_ID=MMETSP1050-20130122/30545_1 /TAXON_ID=233186 /ORGANISM="Cryptomonas curvata, Strain CCAP979/52" /LENGTH=432 /DNA_ID=CAMNT_0012880175 /DNA_START=107 /DNA_END=1403 /DNA_ORIENTATION=-
MYSSVTPLPEIAPIDLFEPTPVHTHLRETVRAFAEAEVDPQANDFNRHERFNQALFRKLGDMGLLGITVPEEYGGAGADVTAACIVHEELAAADPAFCLSYLAHSLLFANNLARNGSDEQKRRLLPRACSGAGVGGMGMSEPEAGTDVLGMRTVARRRADGGYTLAGTKMWITNGTVDGVSVGDFFLVYARIVGEQEGAGAAAAAGGGGSGSKISLFVVEKGTPGFSLGQQIKDKCGMRASPTAELVFDNCHIPSSNLVGEEGGAVKCMMRNLEIERLCLAAMSCGIAKRSVEVMSRYAEDRKAFGQSLLNFGQIQRLIGESYAKMRAGRSYLYATAARLDLDQDPSQSRNRLDTDGVKLFCGAMGKECADAAMQVMGGYGYVGSNQVERLWRDSKLLEIGGGTNEAHHKNIARDLVRAADPHPQRRRNAAA